MHDKGLLLTPPHTPAGLTENGLPKPPFVASLSKARAYRRFSEAQSI